MKKRNNKEVSSLSCKAKVNPNERENPNLKSL